MADEFCKSAFAMLGFFGTLCTRPATKSEISARASNGYNPGGTQFWMISFAKIALQKLDPFDFRA